MNKPKWLTKGAYCRCLGEGIEIFRLGDMYEGKIELFSRDGSSFLESTEKLVLHRNATLEQRPGGIEQRYNVQKINGETTPDAEYFVLRLDIGTKYRDANIAAILKYADEIEEYLPELAWDIRDKYWSID